jgi:hypothetical protein
MGSDAIAEGWIREVVIATKQSEKRSEGTGWVKVYRVGVWESRAV